MKQLLTKCNNAVYLCILYMISMIALGSMVSKAFFAVLLLPFVLYGIYRLFFCEIQIKKPLSYRLLWWIFFALFVLFLFIFAYAVRVESLSWDWGKVIRSASERVLTGNLIDKAYFARYPNNRLWYCVLVFIFYGVKALYPAAELEQFYLFSIAFGCVMVCASILFLHHIAAMLWGEKKAFFAGIFALFCFPLMMWAPYAYTDTSGMLVLMLLLWLWIKADNAQRHGGQILFAALFGITAAVAYKLKVTVFIFVIAALIVLIIRRQSWKKMAIGLCLILFCFAGTGQVLEAGMQQVIDIDDELYNQMELPLTHWIMMSLKYGGYVQEDVDYTMSFPTYEEKKNANIKEIKKRLKEKGVLGCAKFFFTDKQIRTWGDATFSGCDYLSREPVNPDGFFEAFVTQEGAWNWLLLLYGSLYYGVLLAGMFLGGIAAWIGREDRQPLLAGRVTIIGIFALMMIWECNSRYIVLFLPLMVLLSSEGYCKLRKQLYERRARG